MASSNFTSALIWQAKIGSNGDWVDMPSPSAYKIEWEDLDKNSYRSTINGNLFRHVLTRHWYKIGFGWTYITEANLKLVVEKVNQENLYIRCKSPAFTTNTGTGGLTWVEMQGYVSKMSTELLEGRIGYVLSFNFVQSKAVSGQ